MSQFMHRVHFEAQKKSGDFFVYCCRIVTGGWLGMVLGHLFQGMFGFQNLLFFFIIVLTTGMVVRVTKGWGLVSVLVLNLFFVLLGALLRMYIMVAPGA